MTTTPLQPTDFAVIIGYFALMIAIGVYFRQFMKQAKDYFTAQNQVPWWLAGVSHYMSSFSALTFVMYAEIAYLYGRVAVTICWVAVPSCLVAATWIAPLWRRARVLTPVEFLERRYNQVMRQLFAWTGFPLRLADDGLKLYAVGVFVSVGAGLPIRSAIISCGVVMIVYTFMGGLWAVAVTDFVQFIILIMALLIMLPLAFWRGGGWEGFLRQIPSPQYIAPVNPPYGWLYVAGFFVLVLLNLNAGWSLVQRFYCVKDEHEARKVGYLACVLNFIGPPLFFFPLMLARPLIPNLAVPRYAYAAMAAKLLPVGMMGLLITAMLSSTMSCLSGEYNVLASVATTDIYQRLFNRSADPRQLLKAGRVMTGVIGLVVMGIAIWVSVFPKTPLFSLMVMIFGIAVAPMMLPLLGGLIFRKLTWRGAVAGFVAGLISGTVMLILQKVYLPKVTGISATWITFDFQAYTIFTNIAVSVLAMVVCSMFEKRTPADEAKISDFFARMSVPIETTGEFQPSLKLPSPYYIIGLVLMGVGVLLAGVGLFQPTRLGLQIVMAAAAALLITGALIYYANRRSRPAGARQATYHEEMK